MLQNHWTRSLLLRALSLFIGLFVTLLSGIRPAQAALIIIDDFDGIVLGTRSVSLSDSGGTTSMPSFGESGGVGTIVLPANGNSFSVVELSYNWAVPLDFTDGGINTQLYFEFASVSHNHPDTWRSAGTIQATVTTLVGGVPRNDVTFGVGIGQQANIVMAYPFSYFTGTPNWNQVVAIKFAFYSMGTNLAPQPTSVYAINRIRATPDGGSAPIPPSTTLTYNAPTAASVPRSQTTLSFGVTFSGIVSGFSAADVTLNGIAGAVASVSGGSGGRGNTFTINVTGMSTHGTLSVRIVGGVALDDWDQPNFPSSILTVNYGNPPAITNGPPPGGTAGTPYSFSYAATGDPTITFSDTGALPTGLTLSNAGVLSGTPSTPGTFTGTVRAVNTYGSTPQNYSIVIACPPITVVPPTITNPAAAAAYSTTFSASGMSGAYTFDVSAGALPTGLTLNGATGELSGTPRASGAFTFTIRARHNTYTCEGTQAYSINVAPPTLSLAPASLPAGTAGAAYSQPVTASGGNTPYSYAVTSGALPAGLNLSAVGLLSGTPTASGSFTFEVTATDSTTPTASVARSYTLSVAAPVITLAPTSLTAGTAAVAYNATIAASGGTATYSYSIGSGALPAGLSLSAAGAITGTPTASGSFTFSVTATDSTTPAGSGSQSYTLVIGVPVITLAPTSLTGGTAAVAYNATITASGGNGAYSYSIGSGALPAGLSLSTAGAITGTPTASGSFTFSVTATDSTTPAGSGSQSYTLVIGAPVITLAPTTLTGGTAAVAYNATITASGGNGAYSYSIGSGALPAGLSLSTAGALSGTPTASGSFTFSVTATDSTTPAGSGSQSYTLVIGAPVITLAPTTLTGGTAGVAYTATMTASGGNGAYSYSIGSGALPAGLSLSTAGAITGTPTASGSFTFSVTATDSTTPAGSGSQSYTLVIGAPTLAITPATLPDATAGFVYSASLTGSGGNSPYTFSDGAGLPTGMTLAADGTISGTTLLNGNFTFNVTVTDSTTPGATHSQSYTLNVVLPVLTLLPTGLTDAMTDAPYSVTFSATNGIAPYTFSHTGGVLPTGLIFDAATATLSGVPTVDGVYTFTIGVTDTTTATTDRTYTMTVSPQPVVSPPALPCDDHNFIADSMIRSVVTFQDFRVSCRLLVLDGAYMDGTLSAPTHAGSIGIASVLDMGVLQAVDVMGGSGVFPGDVVVCLRGTGAMVFLDARGIPRSPQMVTAWQTPSFPGYTCATLYAPGTLVLVKSDVLPVQAGE
jgi:hypothetical protein